MRRRISKCNELDISRLHGFGGDPAAQGTHFVDAFVLVSGVEVDPGGGMAAELTETPGKLVDEGREECGFETSGERRPCLVLAVEVADIAKARAHVAKRNAQRLRLGGQDSAQRFSQMSVLV